MNMWEKQEKDMLKEYQRKPLINWADSMNRAEIGDWNALAKGGVWTTLVILAGLLLFFFL